METTEHTVQTFSHARCRVKMTGGKKVLFPFSRQTGGGPVRVSSLNPPALTLSFFSDFWVAPCVFTSGLNPRSLCTKKSWSLGSREMVCLAKPLATLPLPWSHRSWQLSQMSWLGQDLHRYLYPMMGTHPHPSHVMPWCSPK